jgi:hypothetical protein
MTDFLGDTLVSEISRDIVAQIAPQELPIFQAVSAAYFANPAYALNNIHPKDDVLGFGIDPVTALITPIVLKVISEVFQFLLDVAKKAAEDGLEKELPIVIRKVFKKYNSSEPLPLTQEQILLIRGQVLKSAERLLSKDKAVSLANAVTVQLVLPSE